MRTLRSIATILFCAAVLNSCDSGGSANSDLALDDPVPRIVGSVFSASNNQPIRDVIISTQPPTQEVSTKIDGTFELSAPSGSGGNFTVFAEHFAYDAQQKRIAVLNGETAIADFSMQSSSNGLVVSPTTLTISDVSLRDTVRLTSTAPNTGFFVLVSDPWISVSPSAGMIVDGETLFLDISVDPDLIPNGANANAEIVINADNGLTGAFINVLIDPVQSDFVDGVNTTRQADCRRPDILRIAFDSPGLSLVQFTPSVMLTADGVIKRDYLLPDNPLLVDSIIMPGLGTATIKHLDNGPEHTVMELFELSPDEEVIAIAGDGDFDINGGRAEIEIALLQGVYCLYIAPTTGEFEPGTNLTMDFGFELPR